MSFTVNHLKMTLFEFECRQCSVHRVNVELRTKRGVRASRGVAGLLLWHVTKPIQSKWPRVGIVRCKTNRCIECWALKNAAATWGIWIFTERRDNEKRVQMLRVPRFCFFFSIQVLSRFKKIFFFKYEQRTVKLICSISDFWSKIFIGNWNYFKRRESENEKMSFIL